MAKGFKFPKVMHEFKAGELHSGSKEGPVVTNPAQAKAIAVSEAKKAGQYAEGGEFVTCPHCGKEIPKMAEGGEMEFSEDSPRMWEIFQTIGNKRVRMSDEQIKKMKTEGIDLDNLLNQTSKNSEGGEISVPESSILYNKPKPEYQKSKPDFQTKTSTGQTIVAESKIMPNEERKPSKFPEMTPELANKYLQKEKEFLGG